MVGVRGPASEGGIPEDSAPSESSGSTPPSGAEPTPPPVNPALANAPVLAAKGNASVQRATFISSDWAGAQALSEELAERAQKVRTLTSFKTLLREIKRLPPTLQVGPIDALRARIARIVPRLDRLEALAGIARATHQIWSSADLGMIVRRLPYSVASLDNSHQSAGYNAANNLLAIGRQSGLMSDENYGVGLAGLAYVLDGVLDERRSHAAEVNRLFDALETIAPAHRPYALEVLGRQRFMMSPAAAEIVTRRALEAATNRAFTPAQRTFITTGLLYGLETLPHPDPRFEAEFAAIYQASRDQDPRVRATMLKGLARHLDRFSEPLRGEIRRAIHEDLAGLEHADASAQALQEVQQKFLALGANPDPMARASLMASIVDDLHKLPDVDQAGPMTNPRVMCYMQLGAMMLQEMGMPTGDAHEDAIWEVNQLMVAARQHLKPAELSTIDQMLRDHNYTPPDD